MEIKEKIAKLVFIPDSIETGRGWSLAQKDNPLLCSSCKSPLFYILIVWGVVDETELIGGFKVVGKNHKFQYSLREVGFNLYCAECGKFEESYHKYFYPKDKVVCYWADEELKLFEKEEIWSCLEQINHTGTFKPRYDSSESRYLKDKIAEYELKNGKKSSKIKKKK